MDSSTEQRVKKIVAEQLGVNEADNWTLLCVTSHQRLHDSDMSSTEVQAAPGCVKPGPSHRLTN